MVQSNPIHGKIPRPGFSLIEILMVLGMVGVVALPFTRMFTFSMQGTVDNLEHINAYNLAREKIEEVKSLPFEYVKSDFENYQEIYNNIPQYSGVFGDPEKFSEVFNDIVTNDRLKDDKEKDVCERFLQLYKKTFFRDYDIYPDEFWRFRRYLTVENFTAGETSAQPRLKKVTVAVFNKKGQRVAELVTLVGKHR